MLFLYGCTLLTFELPEKENIEFLHVIKRGIYAQLFEVSKTNGSWWVNEVKVI